MYTNTVTLIDWLTTRPPCNPLFTCCSNQLYLSIYIVLMKCIWKYWDTPKQAKLIQETCFVWTYIWRIIIQMKEDWTIKGFRAPMTPFKPLMKPLSYPVLIIILLQQWGVVGALQHSQQPLLPLWHKHINTCQDLPPKHPNLWKYTEATDIFQCKLSYLFLQLFNVGLPLQPFQAEGSVTSPHGL